MCIKSTNFPKNKPEEHGPSEQKVETPVEQPKIST